MVKLHVKIGKGDDLDTEIIKFHLPKLPLLIFLLEGLQKTAQTLQHIYFVPCLILGFSLVVGVGTCGFLAKDYLNINCASSSSQPRSSCYGSLFCGTLLNEYGLYQTTVNNISQPLYCKSNNKYFKYCIVISGISIAKFENIKLHNH